ncbi:MAG: cytochrome c [Terriglobales bacterium]
MRKRKRLIVCTIGIAASFFPAAWLYAAPLPAPSARTASPRTTAIAGESWLSHLHRSFDETSMGKTGRLGPPPSDENGPTGSTAILRASEISRKLADAGVNTQKLAPTNHSVVVRGSDLYRMNCRGCHGEDGAGAPPEINSVLNPVRATSTVAVMERMKTAGMEMSRADAVKLAQQSKAMLLARLHHGGQDMPAFPHLSEAEVKSLVVYLRQLARVRGAETEQLTVQEERVRIGEHVAKSTCHICHSAAGPNPTAQQFLDGAIPPLSALTTRLSEAEFVRKVTLGAPVIAGSPAASLRGRMPVFYYLSTDEAADVYLYLDSFPPDRGGDMSAKNASPILASGNSEPSSSVAESSARSQEPTRSPGSITRSDPLITYLPLMAGSFVALLLGFGFCFTVHELKRAQRSRKQRQAVKPEKSDSYSTLSDDNHVASQLIA